MPLLSPTSSIDAVRLRVQDASQTHPNIEDAALDAAIQQAVASEYSRHRPRTVAIELAGDGPMIPVADLTGWTAGFSTVASVEYPATAEEDFGTEGLGPLLDSSHDYQLFVAPGGVYLRLIGYNPAATELVRVSYNVPHVHTTATSTLPAADLEAILDLAASIACLYAATKSTHVMDDTIGAEGINRGSASGRYLRASEVWRDRYMAHMGLGKHKETQPVSAVHDYDMDSTFESTGRRWLTHGRGFAIR